MSERIVDEPHASNQKRLDPAPGKKTRRPRQPSAKAMVAPTLEHLDPVIRPIVQQDDVLRALHILKDLYVSHPPAQRIERQIEHLFRMPRKTRMPGIFLSGDSGMGKTHLLRKIERSHPEYTDPQTQRPVRPVLFVEVPADPKVWTLRAAIMEAAHIAYVHNPQLTPQSVLRRALAAAGTRMIILDEIHNIEHVRAHKVVLRDFVRCLSNQTHLPLILAGIEEFERAMEQDTQLGSRFTIVRLTRWTAGPDLAAFLQGYERACPLKLASHLNDTKIIRALLEETAGLTESIVRCLQAAALVAIRDGVERIIPENFVWWRDPPLLSSYENQSAVEQSEDLARAWLKDSGRHADPIPMMGRVRKNQAALTSQHLF